jgi:outer membrane protein assembly factor BamB
VAAAGTGVVVVDSATGRTRHTVPIDGALLLAEPVGRDLLVAGAGADGRVRVTRWDLGARSPRWDVVSPQPVLAGEAPPAVERRPESLAVGAFAVDLLTGEPLEAAFVTAQPHPYVEHVLSNGAHAVWAWYSNGTSGQGRVSGGSEGSWYSLPGPPLVPPVTDGSGGVLVAPTARGHRLRGLDLRTGRMSWTQRHPGASALRATALVRGVLLLDDGATVTALEVATGRRLWSTPADGAVTAGAALTDGQVVLLPVRGDDGALHLAEHRLADGTVVRRAEVPAGTVSLRVVDHHLVALTEREVVGLG